GEPVDANFRYMASIYQPEDFKDREDIYAPNGRSRTRETQDEMLERIFTYAPEPTDHSSVPGNAEFMKRVVAFDLPIGFCEAHDDRDFWIRLRKKADWTSGYDSYFNTGTLGDYAMPDLVDKQTVDLARSESDAQLLRKEL
ncbi:effector protein Tle3 domain-containing protein, partial [Caballeronia humi]